MVGDFFFGGFVVFVPLFVCGGGWWVCEPVFVVTGFFFSVLLFIWLVLICVF